MTNPSTKCVRTCRPSGHALGSQGPLGDCSRLSDSSSDWPRGPVSASSPARSCASPAAVVSTLSTSHCDRLRSVGWAGLAGRRGGGFSADGVMKGEEGGDWEERLDNAGRGEESDKFVIISVFRINST